MSRATDFGTWTPVTDALPALPHWAVPGFTWAPDVHQFGGTFVLYVTAAVIGTGQQCVGIAAASSPLGPFTSSPSRSPPAQAVHLQPKPFICQPKLGGTIDLRTFTDSSGVDWLVFTSDENVGGASVPTQIRSQRLSVDGLHLVGPATRLLGPR